MERITALLSEISELDAQYQPFPSFSDWIAGQRLDTRRWDNLADEFMSLKESADSDSWREAVQFAIRLASVDTGALEGLYSVDRGITFTIAQQAAAWEAVADESHPDLRKFFEAQLRAYELVLDAVTQATPISEAWLRRLHEELCDAQETYRVLTLAGYQEHPLPRGEYKKYPNHVKTRDGVFAYAPVLETPSEVARFVRELRSSDFQQAHPVFQAAYAHYAFILIHPFADGNGRVARALASLYFYRAAGAPLMIFADQRDQYLAALAQADKGNPAEFIQFLNERGTDLLEIVLERTRIASATPVDQSIEQLQSLLTTPSGLGHHELDGRVYQLTRDFQKELQRQLNHLQFPGGIERSVKISNKNYPALSEEHRIPIKEGGKIIIVTLKSPPPATATASMTLYVHIPKGGSLTSDILITNATDPSVDHPAFSLNIAQLLRPKSKVIESKLSIWAEHIVRTLVARLAEEAENSLNGAGYL